MIGGIGFHRHMVKGGSEVFLTSLYEIDRILEEKRDARRRTEDQETRDTIPQEYHQYADVFSEQDSNTLPPYRGTTDHRILLEERMSPGYCPLYKQSEEELQEAKAYITRNLAQGFIMPSKAPFASPILMVRKLSGGLRFCVDYRKLNALIKKDRYPLPLIDEILQRLRKRNIIADTLSRKDPGSGDRREQILLPRSCLEHGVHPDDLTNPIPASINTFKHAPTYTNDTGNSDIVTRTTLVNKRHETLEELRELARTDEDRPWTLQDRLLLNIGRLVVPDDGDLRARLLNEIHRQPSTAHPGLDKMKALLSTRYYWPGWSTDVKRYMDNCRVCKRAKTWRDRAPGLLQPLPVPDRPWQHITMDFRSFPKDKHGFDAVLVVVDRLTKRPISLPCHKTTGAPELARLFISGVMRYCGLPDSIMSDRGGQFVLEFWTEVCRILGIKRKLSTAHHPQTDGQTQRLRVLVNHRQDDWSNWLPVADFAAAVLQQDSTRRSPFFIKRGGPYKILTKEGHAYKLELPDSIKVHLVFSPDKLRRVAKSAPLIGQIADPALPIEVNDQQEWEVNEIVDVRLRYRKLQYKARWIGIEDDDWYPAGDFKNAPDKLMAFHKRYPELPGPPARLSVWLDATLNDYFVNDHPDDGKPEPRGEPL
ncbi:gag/polymerase/env polyprotein [Penicillium sp. IBT 16267x]|nr:gag/polymerase/env polyprotein [Penicillium sp. IBT 16267x]